MAASASITLSSLHPASRPYSPTTQQMTWGRSGGVGGGEESKGW